ncbi:MAG: hypothetical protein DRN68_07380 [Thaumarchaeota archaeon]|nr:MAG: hypothetical protein DRN68_07380 [Nitrososphaerota archaeon]HDD56431.1 hypothetical protein [Nitrososphaeria archaeon]
MKGEDHVEEASKLILGILAILLLLILFSLMLRLGRGILGLILIGIIVLLGLYWSKEVKKALKTYRPKIEYPLELVENGDLLILTAQVPGPEEEVSVKILGKKLLIRGGKGFKKTIKLPYPVKILKRSYVNGILHLQFVREQRIMNR